MKKHLTTLATVLVTVSLLSSAALASTPVTDFYADDESAITELQTYGIAAFQSDHNVADHQAYLALQKNVDQDMSRLEWDTQITGTDCGLNSEYSVLQAEVDEVLSNLAAE